MRPAPLRTLVFTLLAALGAGACGEVEIKPDSKSGEDFERAGAKQLFLDKLTDDFISFERGDATDWKFLKVPAKGILKVVVFWDTKSVRSITEVRDRFGVMLMNFTHSPELEKDSLEFPVEPGTHFVRRAKLAGVAASSLARAAQAPWQTAPIILASGCDCGHHPRVARLHEISLRSP